MKPCFEQKLLKYPNRNNDVPVTDKEREDLTKDWSECIGSETYLLRSATLANQGTINAFGDTSKFTLIFPKKGDPFETGNPDPDITVEPRKVNYIWLSK